MIVLWAAVALVVYVAIGFVVVTLLMRSKRFAEWEFDRWTEMAMVAWPFVVLTAVVFTVGEPLARLARRLAGRP